jgi:alpha-tubulin suppressor-like RCC1 family protein
VPGLSNVVQLASGGSHRCALLNNGTVRCWGSNRDGQIGDGTTFGDGLSYSRLSPTAALGVTGASEITAGIDHTCARIGTVVRCWGFNASGQVGTTLPSVPTPTVVANLEPVAEVAAGGFHTCARLTTGGVRCWGANDMGQLGNGFGGSPSSTPQTVREAPPPAPPGMIGPDISDVAEITAGVFHACARKGDGTLHCWGDNRFGAIGAGTTGGNRMWATPVTW